jgi:hypothetical protein
MTDNFGRFPCLPPRVAPGIGPVPPGNGGQVAPVGPSGAVDAYWGPRPGGDRLIPIPGGVVSPSPLPVLPDPGSR